MFSKFSSGFLKEYSKLWSQAIAFQLFFFAFTLPLAIRLNNVSIGLILFTWLLSLNTSKLKNLNWVKSHVVLLPCYFVLESLTLIYSDNLDVGLVRLERHSALILIPLGFGIFKDLKDKQVYRLFTIGLISGCLCISLLFVKNYMEAFWMVDKTLTDEAIRDVTPLHASYLSLFLVASTLFLRQFFNTTSTGKLIAVILILFFSAVVILLSSKIAILFLGVTLCYIFYHFLKSSSRMLGIILTCITAGAIIWTIYQSELLVYRFKNIMSLSVERDPVKGYNTFSGRIFIWGCSLDVLKEDFLIGVGVGDAQDKLDECYLEKEPDTVTPDFLGQYNAHNQFLQTAIELGMVGVIFILSGFFILLKYSNRIPEKELFLVVIFFTFFCFFESVLLRNKGVMLLSVLPFLISRLSKQKSS